MRNPFKSPSPPPPVSPIPRGAPAKPPDVFLAVAQLTWDNQLPTRQRPAVEDRFRDILQARQFLRQHGGGTIFSVREDRIIESVDPIEAGGAVHTLADALPQPEEVD